MSEARGSYDWEVPFLKASTVPREFTVVGRVFAFPMHWVSGQGAGVLCGWEDCALCRAGFRQETRYMLRLRESGGSDYLLEVRPRLRTVMEELELLQRGNQTAVVQIWKAGSCRNSPVAVDILRVEAWSSFFDVSNLVKAAYRPAICGDGGHHPGSRQQPPQERRFQDSTSELHARMLELRRLHSGV